MIENAILHYPESKYCNPLSSKSIEIRIRIAKSDNPKIYIVYGGKYDFFAKRRQALMKRTHEDKLFAYYSVILNLKDPRLVYVFKIIEDEKTHYYSEDGLTDKYDFKYNFYNSFQYAYLNECDIIKPIKWMEEATFYQIFVDRFNKGDNNKDLNYINLDWGDIPNPKSFTGGDIKGIYDKLKYLKKLGITAIYLTPIFKSISNHKYDISDYYKIDPQFGNYDILHDLINEAHSMGMKVVLDAVFNHVSENLDQFQDVVKNKKNSKYYSWFVINSDDPFEYECFASCKYMPKLNTSNPEVQKYLIDIATYWIKEFDIDGWRLDVSDEVSHQFWRKFRIEVKNCKPDCVLIGENWHDANAYLNGDQYDSIMNYAFTKATLDYLAFNRFNSNDMANQLNSILMRNNTNVNNMMLNLLDSHDTFRFFTEVKCDENKLNVAIAILFMFPGTPCIYYGTENRMEGGYDPDSRRCMDWRLEHTNNSTKSLIIKLAALKKKIKASDAKIYSFNNLLIIERKVNKNIYRLVMNNNSYEVEYKVNCLYTGNLYINEMILPKGFIIEKI